jgi:hypothetical protein
MGFLYVSISKTQHLYHGFFYDKLAKKGLGHPTLVGTNEGYRPKDTSKDIWVNVTEFIDGGQKFPNTPFIPSLEWYKNLLGKEIQKIFVTVSEDVDEEYRKQWMTDIRLLCPSEESVEIVEESIIDISHLSKLFKDKDDDTFNIVSPGQGYYNPSSDFDRLLGCHCLYFNTQTKRKPVQVGEETYYPYYLGYHGKPEDDEMLGKRIKNNVHSVAYLKKPDQTIDKAIECINESTVHSDFTEVGFVRLNNLLMAKHYDLLNRYNDRSMVRQQTFDNEVFVNIHGYEIGKIMTIPRLAFRTIDELTDLERRLNSYLNFGPSDGEVSEDITSLFIDEADGGSKLKGEYGKVDKTYSHKAKHFRGESKVILMTDRELPNRNVMNKLVDDGVKVELLSWKVNEQSFRYAIILKTKNGVAIRTRSCSNLVILT